MTANDYAYSPSDDYTALEGAAEDFAAPAADWQGILQHTDASQLMDASVNRTDNGYIMPPGVNTEEYDGVQENGFIAVSQSPLSTFSADVDTASYANLRRMIYDGQDINPDAVRIEEIINYFNYDYSEPLDGEPFSVYTEYADCPWNSETKLFMAGLSTKSTDSLLAGREPMNIVFLIDVSGSMYSSDKLPLVQKSFSMLTDNLSEKDRISIVTYAGEDAVLLEGADGGDRKKVLEIIDSLSAGGSTAGAAGIVTAYEIAEKYFIEGGNNRVILATDGDLNVGLSSVDELTGLIEEKRETGVFLSVLGFGTGNYKDNRLEALADHGNGNYSYIDSEREAKKVLVDEMSGTLFTAAKDVKFQIEFNPAQVKGYRLIGYENRKLADRDFADDTKDAGEVGAGHSVTVLYEIIPADSDTDMGDTELKYSQKAETTVTADSTDLLTLSIRYKQPDGDTSSLLAYPVSAQDHRSEMSERLNFASACARFGMILRVSRYCNDISYDGVLEQLSRYDYKADEYKNEFYYLVETMNRRNDDTYPAPAEWNDDVYAH
ncbi:MAG: von Willebrand factor type A domain-containing protein [Oscillospiraceae bacterium]|nr:von Willebrand factor type A domain-containing protein [Oscillospiraceae bacterium]